MTHCLPCRRVAETLASAPCRYWAWPVGAMRRGCMAALSGNLHPSEDQSVSQFPCMNDNHVHLATRPMAGHTQIRPDGHMTPLEHMVESRVEGRQRLTSVNGAADGRHALQLREAGLQLRLRQPPAAAVACQAVCFLAPSRVQAGATRRHGSGGTRHPEPQETPLRPSELSLRPHLSQGQ